MDPPVGTLVAVDHGVFRVDAHLSFTPNIWRVADYRAWIDLGRPPPERWPERPRRWRTTNHHGRAVELRFPAYTRSTTLFTVSEHFAVCDCCGEPWPCMKLTIDAVAAVAMAQLHRLLDLTEDDCWACYQKIRDGQRAIRFDGENLLCPTGPAVSFHLRGDCTLAAADYDDRCAVADPGHIRMVVCMGTWTNHELGRGGGCSLGEHCIGPVRHAVEQPCTVLGPCTQGCAPHWADHRNHR